MSKYTLQDALRNVPGFERYARMAEEGNNPLHAMLREYDAKMASALPDERERMLKIRNAIVQKAKRDGEWLTNEVAWKESFGNIMRIKEVERMFEYIKHLDHRKDAHLITRLFFQIRGVQEECTSDEQFYRAVLEYGFPRMGSEPMERPMYPAKSGDRLDALVANILPGAFSKDDTRYNEFRKVIRKKANSEAFEPFKQDPAKAIRDLEEKLAHAPNEDVAFVYQDVLDTYRSYLDFQFIDANPNFRHPMTGKTEGFPSLHQRIAVKHALDRQRYGVLDGCGTGKTAIGALLFPLVKAKKAKEGQKVHNRMVIVGTRSCHKTWQKGFEGDESVRYLAEKHPMTLINGGKRNEELVEELRKSNVIFVNYEQLPLPFTLKGKQVPTHQVLADLGYDLLVFDEVHNIKNRRDTTAGGAESASAAARRLANRDGLYFLLLSGTPMPDNLEDYSMIYHLLRPDECPTPGAFLDKIKQVNYNPHRLAEFIEENTIRRTADQVNNLSPLNDDRYDDIELTPIQRRLHDYLLGYRPAGWQMEMRKILIDPRLASQRTLERAAVSQPQLADSAKYARLEKLVSKSMAGKEKFVIFSNILKEGITRAKNQGSLHESLEQFVQRKYGSDKRIGIIDGNVNKIADRDTLIAQFQRDPNMVGVMCTTDTGGESLDFSFATQAIFLDEDYSPATSFQAISRLWRQGQTKPVTVKFIRGKCEFEETITEYVDKKDLIIKIAVDGNLATAEELKLLMTSPDSVLTQMIMKKFGGVSIDLSKYHTFDISDVVIKQSRPGKKGHEGSSGNALESSVAQELALRIGEDENCWHDPTFAAKYAAALAGLSPYLASRFRVLDLLNRANAGEILFPRKVLALGSGPGVFSGAVHELASSIKEKGYPVPKVYNLDYSRHMMAYDTNARKVLANMKHIPLADSTFDLVDNASISLLRTPAQIVQMLEDSHRVLKMGGVLELSVKDLYFKESFHEALNKMGFCVITKPHSSLAMSPQKYREMAHEQGLGFAASCKNKIDNWQILLAKKTHAGEAVNASDLWFLTSLGTEYSPIEFDEKESNGRKKGKARWRWHRAKEDVPKLDKPYRRNRDGTVDRE